MTKLEFDVLDKSKNLERSPEARYNTITAGLDSKPDMYEVVTFNESDRDYNLRVYRDSQTTSTISIERNLEENKSPLLVIVGRNDEEIKTALKRIKSITPDIFNFKHIKEKSEDGK